MRSSPEDALSQLNKWKSESSRLFVSCSGLLTFWFAGRVEHASLAESHFIIDGIDTKDFLLSVNFYEARFEFSDAQFEESEMFAAPRRNKNDFGAMLIAHLKNETRIAFAELND